jgi:translation initiation factor IF-2
MSTLKVGDCSHVLAGKHHELKLCMMKEVCIITEAGPSTPVSVLGLDVATAGDKFNVFEDEKEAKQVLQNVPGDA